MTLFIRLILPLCFAAGCATVSAASAQESPPTLSVAAIDPGPSGQLGNQDPLFIKVTYRTDQPVSFQAQGFLHGRMVSGMMVNGLVPQPEGAGETIVSIAYRAGAKVDAIKIRVVDGKYRTLTSIQVPAELSWTAAAPRDPRLYADWVAPLNQINDRIMLWRIATDPQSLIGMAMFLAVPIYLLLQAWLAFAWTGGWRTAALVPLVVVLPALAMTVHATWRGSNIAPVPFILAACPALLYLLVAWVLRRVARPATI